MAKYYVSCMDNREVVNAEDPIDACIQASKKSGMISVGLTWLVSEIGFDIHYEDLRIPDSQILKEIERRMNEDTETSEFNK